ncbi:hypothetical protein [Clostridium sp.]|uniref:hypothetical protein n=1 Tax=Clostridium sp. TaxID=1506 RepID=UPI00262B9AC4|nr:hypothetical protein [Clostridium sp.]
MVQLIKVKTLKTFTYTYANKDEMKEHKENMIKGQFDIERENVEELKITFSQTIKES